MKKDKEWLRAEVERLQVYGDSKVRLVEVLGLIDQLDEPEVTLDKAFEKVAESYSMTKEEVWRQLESFETRTEVLSQEEVDQAYKDGYEKGKQHATEKQSEEAETVASVMADFFGASARLKEVLAMEVEELEE